jgi:hypothetical protein
VRSGMSHTFRASFEMSEWAQTWLNWDSKGLETAKGFNLGVNGVFPPIIAESGQDSILSFGACRSEACGIPDSVTRTFGES